MSERVEVVCEFGGNYDDSCGLDECQEISCRMADEIVRLRSQLAAEQSRTRALQEDMAKLDALCDEAVRERDEWENAAGVYEAGMVRAERERDEARRELAVVTQERNVLRHTEDLAMKRLRTRAERAEQAAVNVITRSISGRDCSDSPCGYGKAAGISQEFCMCRKEAKEEFAEAVRALDAAEGAQGAE